MDLDPLLRPVEDAAAAAAGTASSTPSQSGQFPQQPHAPLYHGQDSPDTPSSTYVSSRDGAETQQQSQQPQHHHHHQHQQQHHLGRAPVDSEALAGGSSSLDAAKKARACEACRGLKVRCEPGPDEEGPCKRCSKADRACVVTMPTRKRQKKTDSRVSELEKKIDLLTASLQGRVAVPVGGSGGGSGGGGGYSTAFPAADASSGYGPSSASSWGGNTTINNNNSGGGGGGGGGVGVGASRAWADNNNHGSHRSSSMETSPSIQRPSPILPQGGPSPDHHRHHHQHQHHHQPLPQLQPQPRPQAQPTIANVTIGHKRKEPDRSEPAVDFGDGRPSPPHAPGGWLRPHQGDMVDRGLMSMDYAASMFDRYTNHMAPHLPAVVFPASMTVVELRQTKPVLFLAIMAASTSENHILQGTLQRELLQVLAEKVFLTGEKSLELVQALLIACIWYWPPEHFEELKFYQLVHLAAVMSIDIGLGKRMVVKRAPPPFRRKMPPDPMSIECRRTWLMCFYLALNTSMSMRRPNLIRWTSFMAESLELLQNSRDAAPSDKYLCHLVNTHRLADQVGGQFSMDDAPSTSGIEDARTQYSLRALERDLDKCVAAVPPEMMNAMLRIGFNIVNLYMHELALHSDTADQWRPPFSAESLKDSFVGSEPLSAAHINALSACLTSIESIFDAFLSMDVPTIRCVPVFTFMRVAYGVVILIKLYITASGHTSEMGKVISKDKMRVEHYLGALIEKFRATAADNKCRFAAKFLVVLVMFRSWFYKRIQSEARDGPPEEAAGATATATAAPGFDRSVQAHQRQQTQQHQQRQGGQLQSPQQRQQAQDQQAQQVQQVPQNVNSPLQLLSEVATGRNPSNPRPMHSNLAGMSRQPAQPIFRGSVPVNAGMVSDSPNLPGLSHLQGLSPGSAGTPGSADLDPAAAAAASMGPGFSPWMAGTQGMPADLNVNAGGSGPGPGGVGVGGDGTGMPNFDLEMLGITVTDPQDFCQNSMRVFMNDPWFSSNVQGLPDSNDLLFR